MKKLLVLFLALVMCMTALASCDFFGNKDNDGEVTYKLDKAVAYVKNLYVGEAVKEEGSDVAIATKYADFERVSSVPIAGVSYDVVWTVSETDQTKVKVVQGSGTTPTVIDVNEKTAVDISFTLTATVKAGDGTSDTLTFNIFVPKYDVISYEDYRAKADGESATVEAIVVALNSKSAGNKRNHIFAVDASGKGGYYAYDMEDDPAKLGIEVGMTVAISGEVDIYNGMYELKSAVARVVNPAKQTPAAIDVTTKFGAGDDILEYVGALITIKGVEIGAQELDVANSQYLFFSLNGNESYIRTYVTDLPTSFDVTTDADGNTVCADKAVIDGAHAEKFGWTANVTGVLIAYNGAPYLMPVNASCFEYLRLIEKSDEEKIAAELANVTFNSSYGSSTELDLLLAGVNYSNVVFSYSSNNTDVAVVEDGKLKLTVGDNEVTVQITVTASIGNKSDSKTISIKLSKDPTPIKDIADLADGANVIVKGVVVEAGSWNSEFNNMSVWIFDGTGKIQAYRTKTELKVGDQVTLTGTVGSYNNVKQIAQGSTAVINVAAPEAETTVTDILDLADGTYVMFSATVAEIKDAWNSQYNNMSVWITDGTTRLQAYRTTTQLEVGDVVTFFGKVGSYNNVKQIAAGSYAYVTGKALEEGASELAFTADNRTSFDPATAAVYEANDVKFTIAKGTSTNDLGDYNAPARIYQGCVATIECAGMTKIVFNVNSGKPVSALTDSIPESANYTVEVEGNVVTLTFTAPANSLEISAGAQFRLDSIVVYQ